MLVLEWLDGVPSRDAGPRMQAITIDRSSLTRELLAAFLEQVLQLGIFNADPHPGNELILADDTLGQIDFGSVGRLRAAQRLALARLLLASTARMRSYCSIAWPERGGALAVRGEPGSARRRC